MFFLLFLLRKDLRDFVFVHFRNGITFDCLARSLDQASSLITRPRCATGTEKTICVSVWPNF